MTFSVLMLKYLNKTSGAIYAIEPQNDFEKSLVCFDNPKSVTLAWPSGSKTTLAGLRSLKIIYLLCNDSKANNTSAA